MSEHTPTPNNHDRLTRENEAMRKALEEIQDLGENGGCTAARLGNIAHAALISLKDPSA